MNKLGLYPTAVTIEVILVRHAIAFERDRARWADDRLRPLSPEGKKKFRRAAAGIAAWLPKVDRMFSSPLVRARETASLLTTIAGWPAATEVEELTPESTPASVLAMLRTQTAKRIALVGHEPGLSALLSLCIDATGTHLPVTMKKGGIACISFASGIRAGRGTLNALVTPQVLRKIRVSKS